MKLKVYERFFKESRKKKRNRKRFKLAVLATAVVVSAHNFVGCNVSRQQNNTAQTAYTTIEPSEYEKQLESLTEEYVNNGIDDYSKAIMNAEIQIDENTYNLTKQEIDNIEADYPYKDIYETEKAYEKYKQLSFPNVETTKILENKHISLDRLIEIVQQNNKKYLQEHKVRTYEELDYSDLYNICTVFVDTLNKELSSNDFSMTIDDLSQNLSDLKIFRGYIVDNANITDDNCLLVSLTSINGMKTITDNENADKIVIAHEAEHFIQKICLKAIQKMNVKRSYGYCVEFEDLKVNSLYHNWLVEGAAENLACRLYDSLPTTYKTKIGYINSLTLVNLLYDQFKPYDIERLTQQSSLNKLFETFYCDNEKKKIELLDMMESINIIQEEPDDFMTVYEQQLGHEINDDELVALKVNLKNSVCTTLTKYFYNSLLEQLKKEPTKIEDLFSLISIFEADMSGHISYAEENNYETREKFLNNYLLIQNNFFDDIAKTLNISLEDLINAYQTYNGSIEVQFDSSLTPAHYEELKLSCLNAEKNKFVNKIFRSTINNKKLSIREIVNLCKKVNQLTSK